MDSDADNKMALANNQILSGAMTASGCTPMASHQGGCYTQVSDGHGNWFDDPQQARGSQMQIEGKIKRGEAFDLKRIVIIKRAKLARLKAQSTP